MNAREDDPNELDAELRAIVRAAADLPVLEPSRDLWRGIEARIEAPVVALPAGLMHVDAKASGPASGRFWSAPAGLPWRRLAVAASLLVTVTAGVTYLVVKQGGTAALAGTGDTAAAAARPSGLSVEPVSLRLPGQTAEETFDREIGAMRTIIDERRAELDTATIRVLERNLKLIDAAIAESKAALAKDPASAFLMDRLTRAYDTKLQLLRGVASFPAHG